MLVRSEGIRPRPEGTQGYGRSRAKQGCGRLYLHLATGSLARIAALAHTADMSTTKIASPITSVSTPGSRPDERHWPPATAQIGWIMFDWATQPFFSLVTTFVFAPFFASALAADAAQGQALWGFTTGAAGLAIAIASPVLGAVADELGPRKPWIALFGLFIVVGCVMLWFARPGAEYAIAIALTGLFVATIGAEFATVFNNAMMPTLAPPEKLGKLSGTGWAVGYAGGLVSLALTLGFVAASPETGKTIAGLAPAFGLDAASRAGDRIVGPLSAAWFVVFVLPMMLLTPDVAKTGKRMGEAVRSGIASLKDTIRGLRGQRDLARFLVANMVYTDGLVALFAFGGIYAAGIFGWGTIQIGIFGILIMLMGAFGAYAGGRLDDRLGPKPVIAGALVLLIFASVSILSTTRDTIFFIVPVAPAEADGPLFASTAERVYVALGILIGVVAGPLQAASRTLLIRLAPEDRVGQCFGLFALSGKVTSFIGPTLVGVVTAISASQRAGMTVLVAFFSIGLFLILRVSVRR